MKRQFYIVLLLVLSGYVCMAQSLGVISPNSAGQGDNLNIGISGEFTNFGMGTNTVWFSQGTSTAIYPNSLNVVAQDFLQANFTFNYSHLTGFYDVNVYNNTDGWLNLPNGFYLYAGSNPPQIIQISPDSAFQGQSLSVDITGDNTNFGMGTSTTPVWFTQGTVTIYADSVMLNTPTSLTANFSIPFDAGLGYWDVSVSSPLDGTVTDGSGFYVYLASSIELNNSEIDISLNIYPNPASRLFYIQSNELIEHITVSNLAGQKIYSKAHDGNFAKIEINGLAPSGIYLVSVRTTKGRQVRRITF